MTTDDRNQLAAAQSLMTADSRAGVVLHMDDRGMVHMAFSGPLESISFMGRALDTWLLQQITRPPDVRP